MTTIAYAAEPANWDTPGARYWGARSGSWRGASWWRVWHGGCGRFVSATCRRGTEVVCGRRGAGCTLVVASEDGRAPDGDGDVLVHRLGGFDAPLGRGSGSDGGGGRPSRCA